MSHIYVSLLSLELEISLLFSIVKQNLRFFSPPELYLVMQQDERKQLSQISYNKSKPAAFGTSGSLINSTPCPFNSELKLKSYEWLLELRQCYLALITLLFAAQIRLN